jgi:glucuronyl/N-acetylglucosaminyl transferase EXT2
MKVVVCVLSGCVLKLFLVRQHFHADHPFYADSETPDADASACTLVVNGYTRVNTIAAVAVHYAKMKLFSRVIISWGNPKTKPPTERITDLASLHDVVIHIRREKDDDLNLRFSPGDDYTRCVFVADDDILVSEKRVLVLYDTWKFAKDQIAGLFPRSHDTMYTDGGPLWYESDPSNQYSIILTKFMVVDSRFLHAYWGQAQAPLREWVRSQNNCEDLAFNAVVSNLTSLPPIYVEAVEKLDFGGSSGLGNRGSHVRQRNECLNFISEFFGGCPLVHSTVAVSGFGRDVFQSQAGVNTEESVERAWKGALKHKQQLSKYYESMNEKKDVEVLLS